MCKKKNEITVVQRIVEENEDDEELITYQRECERNDV